MKKEFMEILSRNFSSLEDAAEGVFENSLQSNLNTDDHRRVVEEMIKEGILRRGKSRKNRFFLDQKGEDVIIDTRLK